MNNNFVRTMSDVTKESMTELLTKYANDLNMILGSHLKVYQLNYQEREVLIRELLELAGDLMQDSVILGVNCITERTLTAIKGGTCE